MKQVVVTGLDGSGKSTFFSKLADHPTPHVQVLQLPHIQLPLFEGKENLHRAAAFINAISARADAQQLTFLKAVAFFSSMVLFKDLCTHLTTPGTRFMFCERHPLVDTGIYARFYASKLHPAGLPPEALEQTDADFADALRFILGKLPLHPGMKHASLCGVLCTFMHEWFHEQKKSSPEHLATLFQLEWPDEVYFLQAPAAVLFGRIKHRKQPEPHESEPVLQMLDHAYGELLATIHAAGTCKVSLVDAGSIESLDRFFYTIREQYLHEAIT